MTDLTAKGQTSGGASDQMTYHYQTESCEWIVHPTIERCSLCIDEVIDYPTVAVRPATEPTCWTRGAPTVIGRGKSDCVRAIRSRIGVVRVRSVSARVCTAGVSTTACRSCRLRAASGVARESHKVE